jgi:hypothetical protein
MKQEIIGMSGARHARFIERRSRAGCLIDGQERDLTKHSCIQDLTASGCLREETDMAETVIKLRLNQQQLELLDRTIAQGVAPDRVSLVRLALREYAAARKADGTARPA